MNAQSTAGRGGAPLLLGAIALLAALAAGLDRPIHIDDDVYLWSARRILADPADPLGGEGTFIGERGQLYHFIQHPPLLSYFQAAVIALAGGERERALHLAYWLFPIGAAVALHDLARRFTSLPLAATALVLSTPAFLVMSHGLMTDLPFLALWLAAVAAGVRATDGGAAGARLACGAFAALATFVQYRGLLLAPLLLAYPWLRGRPLRPLLAALLPTPLLFAAWSLWTWRTLGVAHPLDAGSWIPLDGRRLAFDAVAYVALLGGTTVLGPLWLLVARRLGAGARGFGLVAALTAVATLAWTGEYTPAQRVAFAAFFACGAAALLSLAAARRGLGREAGRDDAFLLLMAVVPLVSQVALNLFASARSLLVALPFVVLVTLRGLERRQPAPGLARDAWLAAGATLLLAAAVAAADYRFAQAQREVALQAAALRPRGGGRWFTGEWGFRHYMERAGFRPLAADGSGVAPGDLIVIPEVPCPAPLADELAARLRLAADIAPRTRFPLKVMSFEARAGFYSNFHGLLPFALSDAPLERARAYTVGAPPRPSGDPW